MTQRFLVYPLVILVVLRLVSLARSDGRWYWMQIGQLMVTLALAGAAVWFSEQTAWAVAAWTFFGVFVVEPQLLLRRAMHLELVSRWKQAGRQWRLAGRLTLGRLGWLYRQHGMVLQWIHVGETAKALARLDELAESGLPELLAGQVRLWKLTALSVRRDWPAVVEFYDGVDDWGALALAMQARLLVARAYAETGAVERAVRSLQFVALSPRTVGGMERQLWLTRVAVAALAGDVAELAALLQRRAPWWRRRAATQFAAYWRGRCALARGEHTAAAQLLTRALGLTNPRHRAWREAIAGYLQRAEAGTAATGTVAPPGWAAQQPMYALAQEGLQAADRQMTAWRVLMQFGQPAAVTLGLLAVLVVIFAVDTVVFTQWLDAPLWWWVGNVPEDVVQGQWWRPVTALLLHASLLHLAMNAVAVWMFGSAVERTLGWWRMPVIFFVAGTLGNFASVLRGGFDVSVGASSGLFGLVAAYVVAVYRLDMPVVASARRRLLVMLGMMVATDLMIGWLEPQVDGVAHAGGFVAGLLLTLVLRPRW